MIAVMAGVAIVARCSGSSDPSLGSDPAPTRRTVWVSLASAAGFGFALAAGQQSGAAFGDMQSVCAGRWIGVVVCIVPLLVRGPGVEPGRSDAEAYADCVPFPFAATRAKGRRFDAEARRRAGLSEAFIAAVRGARSPS